MIAMFKDLSDRFFGRGAYSVSVPPMDGALQPNSRLEEGKSLHKGIAPDNLLRFNGNVYFSDRTQVFELGTAGATAIGSPFDADILAMAAVGDQIAVVTSDGRLFAGAPGKLAEVQVGTSLPLAHTTALAADEVGNLIVAVGSGRRSPQDWTRDLMERRAEGSVWSVPRIGGTARKLASKLAWPAGVLVRNGAVYASEAWRHRIVKLGEAGRTIPVLAHLPGYPGRLAADEAGGAVLSVFAPRSQLIELVLRQPVYRRRMMEEVPQHLWVAPAYASGRSFLEPLQGGAVKQMGILKPWAPTRSYGLVVRLDKDFQPLESWHSRTDGRRHGITSAISGSGRIIASSRGSGELIELTVREAM